MENENISPPPVSDSLSDAELLSIISTHPEAAHALAAIACGADVAATLATLLPPDTNHEPPATSEPPAEEAEPSAAPVQSIPVGSPSFLGGARTDFWDDNFLNS